MRRLLCSVALVLSAASASAQALDDVLATVNGRNITLGELLIARAELPPQFQSLPVDVIYDGLLTQVIQQQLLADTMTELPKRLELAILSEERALKAGEVLLGLSDTATSEEAVIARYRADYPEQTGGPEYRARHILVGSEERAIEIIDLFVGGEDFAELAKAHSTGPSGPSGGDLGWFGAGVMVPAFELAIKEMNPGEISPPVQTQFGWHVIKLEEVRVQDAPSFEEVRDEIEELLRSEAIEDYVRQLQDRAEISRTPDVDPSVISLMELLELR